MLTFEGSAPARLCLVLGVPVVPWPSGADERRRARGGAACSDAAGAPPAASGGHAGRLGPVTPTWTSSNCQRTLATVAGGAREPRLGEHGLVHREDLGSPYPKRRHGRRAPLIAKPRAGRAREEVRAYEAAVGERPENAFTGLLGRLRAKLAELGVVLHRLSGGRLLLEVCSSPTRA